MYQRLVNYKNEYGNCCVPQGWKADEELWRWVARQRRCRDALDESRKNSLDAIGFDWNPRDTVWNEMYERLVSFERVHGNCNVPGDCLNDKSLAKWVAAQRVLYKRGQLRLDRKELLDQAAFPWSAKRQSKSS
jgi:hypothetical protein